MADSVVPFATITLSRVLGGETPVRGGEYLTGGVAGYNTYATKDGESVTLGALEPKFLSRFCKGAGVDLDAMAIVPGPHQAALKEKLAAVFLARTRAEWQAFNDVHDCCLEPVLRPDELLADPQLRARGVFVETEAGGQKFHEYRTPVTPKDLVPAPAPKTAEHTDAVLAEAGFSKEEVAQLRASGVVR
jgi:alpha-methylacyl-CoA racemase